MRTVIFCASLLVTAVISRGLDPNSLPEINANLNCATYSGNPIFANALYIDQRNWQDSITGNTVMRDSGQLDADGYPLYLSGTQTLYTQPCQNMGLASDGTSRRDGLTAGQVVLTWQGDADIRLDNNATYLSGSAATGSVVNGRRVYNFLNTNSQGLRVRIFSINSANHPTKIRLWLPDPTDPTNKSLEPAQGQPEPIFHPSYISLLQPFGVFRSMAIVDTNSSPQQDWTDRRKPTDCFMEGIINRRAPAPNTSGDRRTGCCYEYLISLCNTTGQDLWLNVPHLATTTPGGYVEKLAKLILYGGDATGEPYSTTVQNPVWPPLNSNLRVWIEYSNEIWQSNNDAFRQGDWATAQATALGITKPQFVARQASAVWQIFQNVFGSTNRLVRLAGAWTAHPENYTYAYMTELTGTYVANTYGTAPDALSVTDYFGNGIQDYIITSGSSFYSNPVEPNLTTAFTEWANRLMSGASSTSGVDNVGSTGGIGEANRDIANQYHLPIVCYEGGPGLPTNAQQGQATNFVIAMSRDPRIADMYWIDLNMAKSLGMYTTGMFTDVGQWGVFGCWGHKEYIDQPTAVAPKYSFMLEWMASQQGVRNVNSPLGSVPTFTTGVLISGTSAAQMYQLPGAVIGEPYAQRINVAGGDGTVVLTQIYSTLPTGLTFDGTSQVVGTPTATGTGYLLLSAADSDGDPTWRVFSLTTDIGVPVVCQGVTAEDGYVLESAQGSGVGGSCSATGSSSSASRVGDDPSNKQYKAIFSFDTSILAPYPTILSANLRLNYLYLSGTDPFSSLGACYADISGTSGFSGSLTLQNADFQAAAAATQVAIMPPVPKGSWSEGVLNSQGLANLNKNGHTQFRVYMQVATNGNGVTDYIGFGTQEYATAGSRPQLVVKAQPIYTNHPPYFISKPLVGPVATEQTAYSTTLAGTATDPDLASGDALTFSKVSGASWLTVAANGSISGTPAHTDISTETFVVRVTDKRGFTDDCTLQVTVRALNSPPTFTSNPLNKANGTQYQAYTGSIAGDATDVDIPYGDSLTFTLVSGSSWLTVGSNGSLAGTPGLGTSGTNTFTVKVTDTGGLSATTTMNIYVTPVDTAPTFTSNPLNKANGTQYQAYTGSITGDATDVDIPYGDSLTFTLVSGSSWLTVGSNGSLTGTPGLGNSGTNTFTVKVTDTGELSATTTMNIYITPVDTAPTFTSNPLNKANGTQYQAYTGSIAGDATDVDIPYGDSLTFTLVSGSSWLTVGSDGSLTGTPGLGNSGTNTFTVKVTDTALLSATTTVIIYVTPVPTVMTLKSIAADDGYLQESARSSGTGGLSNAVGTSSSAIRVGDDATNTQFKSVLSFDTSSIPVGATVLSGTLRMQRGILYGTSPFTNMGTCYADIAGSTGFNGSTILEKQDFQASAVVTQVATMSNPAANGDWSSGVINQTGLTYINRSGKTQFRVYMSTPTDNDGVTDYVGFWSGEHTGGEPQLIITYQQ